MCGIVGFMDLRGEREAFLQAHSYRKPGCRKHHASTQRHGLAWTIRCVLCVIKITSVLWVLLKFQALCDAVSYHILFG